jgi:hypothetical protein
LNSVGELGAEQIKRGEVLLANQEFSEMALLHLMHHQVAVPRARPVTKHPVLKKEAAVHTLGMGLQTAEHLLRFIQKRAQRTCILHGHHHKYFVCREMKTNTPVISAPSSRFGTEVSFSRHVIAANKPHWLMLGFRIQETHLDLADVKPR